MSKEPIPDDPTDDELESLAQDLFGVSLNEKQDLEPFDVGDFDLDDADPEAESESATEEESAADDQRSAAGQPADADEEDFGASLLDHEDEPPPAPPAKQRSEPVTAPAATVAESGPVDSETDKLTEEDEADEPVTSDTEDDYWDALDGFDWNEDSDTPAPKSPLRKEYVESSDTFEDLSIESAEKTDEFLDDADFGAGLDDEDAAAKVTSGAESEEESDSDSDRKGGRRRRGRRRGKRSRSPETAGRDESSKVDAQPNQSQAGTKETKEKEEVRSEKSDSSDDGFGAGLDFESGQDEEDQEQPKKRRRRGGRRRKRPKTSPDASASESSAGEAAEDDRPEPDGKETDASRKKSKEDKYRSVPTWEEAIGYLVRTTSKKSGQGEKSGSRRGGRRGSGRRRRS